MRPVLLLIALLSAGAALWLWLDLPTSMTAPGPAAPQSVATNAPTVVLVAARDIAAGETLATGDVTWADLPAGTAPDGLARQDQMPDAATRIAGLTAKDALAAGSPIPWSMASAPAEAPLAARIAPGKFALAIVVSEATAAGGLILPGDRVDILALDSRAASGNQAVSVIAANVPVLAVDQTMARPSGADALPARTMTLELDSGLVATVSTAAMKGGVSVVLRSSASAD